MRADVIEKLIGNSIPGCIDLLDYGVAYWPPLERKTCILIFERPLGGRVIDVLKDEKSDYNKIDYIKSSVNAMIVGQRNYILGTSITGPFVMTICFPR